MRLIFSLIFACMLIISGCDAADSSDASKKEEAGINSSYLQSHNTFGFNLFQAVAKEETGENVFLSPTSAFIALSMLYNAADGMTKDEIAQTLELDEQDLDQLNKMNQALLSLYNEDSSDITLQLANSIWLNDDFEFQDQFSQAMEDYYEAVIEPIDIYEKASVEKINEWIETATEGKIKDMFEDLPPGLVTLLINAIYFDAAWTIPFDEAQTKDRDFYLSADQGVEIPFMMRHDEDFTYLAKEDIQAIQLPYGDEGQMAMTIILPEEKTSIDDLLEELTYDTWQQWQEDLSVKEGTLLLPSFTFEYEVLLNDYLMELGMPSAFNDQADLTKLVKDSNDLYVSEVRQKSFIKVDEEGTEAAAATSVGIMEMSFTGEEQPFFMEVNRPFLLTIHDLEEGTILFIGAIQDPS